MHVEWVDDEAVVLNVADGKLHYLNPPAALFYALVLEKGYSEAVKELRKSHKVRFRRKKQLQALVQALSAEGLLVDD